MITKDSAAFIEPLLQCLRAYADELVVAVDGATTDSTEDLCRRYVDKLFRVELRRFPGPIHAWLQSQCSRQWILWIDHDELPSVKLIKELPRLMADREITQYWIPRRWVAASDPGMWIAQRPWIHDWQPRLYRNIRSIVRYPGTHDLHNYLQVLGASRYLEDVAIYHLNHVYFNEAERRTKVDSYEQLAPGASQAHYYLVPENSTLELRRIPDDDPPWEPSHHPRPTSPQSFLLRHRLSFNKRPPLVTQVIGWEEMCRLSLQGWDYLPAVFGATLSPGECPSTMASGETYPVFVRVRNDSPILWASPGIGAPEVRVSYHWLSPNGDWYEYNGNRGAIPHTLRPGETTGALVPVLAPRDPGHYQLQWDLVIENVAWFSDNAWAGPKNSIVVEGATEV